jgi:hypothetical protein
MAHFAELHKNGNVLRVVVISNDDCLDTSGVESESVGIEFCQSLWGGTWIQTSYNGNIRGKYAAIGDLYDETNDIFISPVYPTGLDNANFGATGADGATGQLVEEGPVGLTETPAMEMVNGAPGPQE